ncbi:MAG: crotonase/enoyl-CoA hydratase family protein [Hyphomicrobium sp.]
MSNGIDVTRSGGIQTIRLNRPEKKNALTSAMYAELVKAFDEGDAAGDVAAHVVLGLKGVFCAGNDIGDFLAFAKGGGMPLETILAFLGKLPLIQKPVVAGVDGVAVGVGVTMLMHFDLVYASAHSVFSTPFLDLGLVPEAASSLLMPRVMGRHRAFEMLVLGEPFPAERARDCGLINEVVASDQVEEKALGAAKRLARKPPEALAIARRLVRGDPADILARTKEEAKLFAERLSSPEAVEAFQAFIEKRAPNFSGGPVSGGPVSGGKADG